MNMMTQVEPRLAPARIPMSQHRLLAHVDTALTMSGVSATNFGYRLCGDNSLLQDIRERGRNPRRRLRLAIEDLADQLIKEAREHAFNLLIATDGKRGVGAIVESLIAMLDSRDGDPDFENVGAEDDFMRHPVGRGAGCELSDPDKGLEEDGDATSWAEWHTLPPSRRRAGHIDGKPADAWFTTVSEDAEDDDQDGCMALDDDPARRLSDGLPGDRLDTELNGDETDYSA